MAKKEIEEKTWYEFEVDGKVYGVMEQSASAEKFIRQLDGLVGIEVRPASPENLIRYQAKTKVPGALVRKFRDAQHQKRK